jgi:pimeloyl-ACP methyl ester carboxylesterase
VEPSHPTSPARGSLRAAWKLLTVALGLILVGGYLAHRVQTSGGTVEIRDVRFMGTDRTMMSGLLYVPPGASAKTPAPAILAIHGYINSRETQDCFAIELARRGYVVLALDQTGHGFSDGPAFANGFGGPDGLRYLRTLDIVDKENIGVEGHSMGGYASFSIAGTLPGQYRAMALFGTSGGTRGAPIGQPGVPANLRMVFSERDEFAKFMYGADTAAGVPGSPKMKQLFGTTEPVQVGKIYGSFENGTAQQLLMPPHNHTGDHFVPSTVGLAVEWFAQTLKGGKAIPAGDQTWHWKQRGTLLALLGMVLLLFPLGAILLETRFFRPLAGPEPEAKPIRGLGWWISALLLAAIPALTFFRFQHLVDAPYKASWLLPQNLTTGMMCWAVGNGLISLVLFLAWHFALNRKTGATARAYGWTWDDGLRWREIGRSFLLAAAIALSAYLLLALSDWLFKTDFRFFVFAMKPMSPLRFQIFLGYLVPFTFFFLVLGTVLHGQMRLTAPDGQPVGLGRAMLVNVALLLVGLLVLELYQYVPLWSGGANGSLAIPKEALLTIVGYQFFPILAIVALVSTYFFRKTGHVYVGAFLCGLLVTWNIVAGQAIHYKF